MGEFPDVVCVGGAEQKNGAWTGRWQPQRRRRGGRRLIFPFIALMADWDPSSFGGRGRDIQTSDMTSDSR